MSRPDKLRAARTGGYSDVEIVFDGKTLTVNNKDGNAFAQMESSGSVDQLIDTLRDKHGIAAPGADLLFRAFNAWQITLMIGWPIGIAALLFLQREKLKGSK